MRCFSPLAWLVASTLSFGILAGCGSRDEYREFDETKDSAEAHDHHHHHHDEPGPHGGKLLELGDHEYHAELLYEAETGKLTVYILEHDPNKTRPIEESEITLTLKLHGEESSVQLQANPLDDDPEGKSSRFEGIDEHLAEHSHAESELEGTLSVTIDGKAFTGKIEHGHDHDHHHDHDH